MKKQATRGRKLTPCPFCGAPAEFIHDRISEEDDEMAGVQCQHCRAGTYLFDVDRGSGATGEQRATEAWNRRAASGVPGALDPLRAWADKWYPLIAGRVITLQDAGETTALGSWAPCAKELHAALQAGSLAPHLGAPNETLEDQVEAGWEEWETKRRAAHLGAREPLLALAVSWEMGATGYDHDAGREEGYHQFGAANVARAHAERLRLCAEQLREVLDGTPSSLPVGDAGEAPKAPGYIRGWANATDHESPRENGADYLMGYAAGYEARLNGAASGVPAPRGGEEESAEANHAPVSERLAAASTVIRSQCSHCGGPHMDYLCNRSGEPERGLPEPSKVWVLERGSQHEDTRIVAIYADEAEGRTALAREADDLFALWQRVWADHPEELAALTKAPTESGNGFLVGCDGVWLTSHDIVAALPRREGEAT